MTSKLNGFRMVGLFAIVAMLGAFVPTPATPVAVAATATVTYTFTGAEQTFTVPADVTTIHVVARGAPGSPGTGDSAGGLGAVVTADLSVIPGQVLYVNVGGLGTNDPVQCYSLVNCVGGYNGGGSSVFGGGGGGASDVRTASSDLSTRLIVAAGGGGGGEDWSASGCGNLWGGAGGDAGANGGNGQPCQGSPGGTGGGAGTASAGGSGGTPHGGAGSLGQGGDGGLNTGGGGGGGLYGGGGGGDLSYSGDLEDFLPAGGGGGGSNFVPPGGTAGLSTAAPSVVISYEFADTTPPDTSITATPASLSSSSSATFSFEGTDNVALAGFECNLNGGGFTSCTSPQAFTGLADGTNTFQVRAVDTDNNVDPTPASYSWTIDTVAPTITVPANITVNATGPSGAIVNSPAPVVSGATGAAACTLPSGSLFAVGVHTVTCTATDDAGNTIAGSFTVTVVGGTDLLVKLTADTIALVDHRATERTMGVTLLAAYMLLNGGNNQIAQVMLTQYDQQLTAAVNTRRLSPAAAAYLRAQLALVRDAIT